MRIKHVIGLVLTVHVAFEVVGWHSFRNTHATLLTEVGESIKTTQAILGHSDLNTHLTSTRIRSPNRSGGQSIA